MKKMISVIYLHDNRGVATLSLIEETLSDGSKVFNITIGQHEIACVNELLAIDAFSEISRALERASVSGVHVN